LSKQIWLNGDLVPPEQATVSVFDHGLLYGDGVFEGIRIYNSRIFKLKTHLQRLFDSAKAIRIDIPHTLEQLTEATRKTVDANGLSNGYIRICVTRGVGQLGIDPFKCENASVFIIVDSISMYPPELYEDGMAVITSSVIRNHPAALSPRIKSLNYLNNILAKIEARDAGVLEAVMLNHLGFVSECTGDNIFVIKHHADQTPYVATPPLHAGILEGVTMTTVIDLATQAGYEVSREDLTQYDLFTAKEMFLTGSGAEVIPVTKVDGRTIANGEPGPVTRQLTADFHQLVGNNAPED
jgi:branched-chain amino acid aminotransferase